VKTPTTARNPGEGGSRPGMPNPSVQVLEDVALLLHQAALQGWVVADQDGIASGMHHLALGAYLALGSAVALLPSAHQMSQDYPPTVPPAEFDPGRLVRSAETRLRAIAPGTVPDLSALIVEVCDLIRECRDDDD
jgi:hypothetical protein